MVAPQAAGDLDQEPVAGPVTERIVDDLEVVEVEEQHRDLGPAPAAACQRPLDVVAEEDPVGQPGQRVVQRVVEELLLEALLVGRVDEQALRDPAPVAGSSVMLIGLVVDPDHRAVPGRHPVVGPERPLRRPVLVVRRDRRVEVGGMDQRAARAPGRRMNASRRVAEDRLDLRAHVGDPAAVRELAASATSM